VGNLCDTLATTSRLPFVRQALEWRLEQGSQIQSEPVPDLAVPTFRETLSTGDTQLLVVV
jgi:hypothetical protein